MLRILVCGRIPSHSSIRGSRRPRQRRLATNPLCCLLGTGNGKKFFFIKYCPNWSHPLVEKCHKLALNSRFVFSGTFMKMDLSPKLQSVERLHCSFALHRILQRSRIAHNARTVRSNSSDLVCACVRAWVLPPLNSSTRLRCLPPIRRQKLRCREIMPQ